MVPTERTGRRYFDSRYTQALRIPRFGTPPPYLASIPIKHINIWFVYMLSLAVYAARIFHTAYAEKASRVVGRKHLQMRCARDNNQSEGITLCNLISATLSASHVPYIAICVCIRACRRSCPWPLVTSVSQHSINAV